MRIAGVASALPENRYGQAVITETLKRPWEGQLTNPDMLERLHSRTGVESRYLAFPLQRYPRFASWRQTNDAWLAVAEELGTRAIDGALQSAGLSRQDLDALFVVSITGVASP